MQTKGSLAHVGSAVVAAVLMIGLAVVPAVFAQTAGAIPETVAKVNGVAIPSSRFIQQSLDFHGVYLLENLIATTLLEEEAKKQNITATPEEIDSKVAALKKSVGILTPASFRSWLLSNEWTEARHREKARLMILVEKVFAEKANVTDAEVEKFYNENKTAFTLQPVATMWLLVARTEELANKAVGMAKAGQSFPDIAAALGSNVRTSTQAVASPIPAMPATVRALVEKATPGQILGPLAQPENPLQPEGPKVYQVFRLEQKQEQRVRTFSEVKDEIRQALFDERVFGDLGLWVKWLDNARKTATIERFITFTGEPTVEAAASK